MSNPYELRFKVLEMARDLEMNRYDQMNGAFWHLHIELENTIAKIRDTGDISAMRKLEEQLDNVKSFLPKIPQPSDIKSKASELYEFVTEK
jgi:hypothetical protein